MIAIAYPHALLGSWIAKRDLAAFSLEALAVL
jgi:hypothetical protein